MSRLGRLDAEAEVERRMAPLLAKKKALFNNIQAVNHQINNTMINGVNETHARDKGLQQGVPSKPGKDVKSEKSPDPLLEFLTTQIKQKVLGLFLKRFFSSNMVVLDIRPNSFKKNPIFGIKTKSLHYCLNSV